MIFNMLKTKYLAITALLFALVSCKKLRLEKYEFNHSLDLPNIDETPCGFEIWNILADEGVSKKLSYIENENSFERDGDQIEYLETVFVQDETENKILNDLNATFLDGHSYYLITFEIGDIYDFDSSFDEERNVNPAYTKTVVLKNNRYGYLKWWKVNDNNFKIFEYSVLDANGNIMKTRFKK